MRQRETGHETNRVGTGHVQWSVLKSEKWKMFQVAGDISCASGDQMGVLFGITLER